MVLELAGKLAQRQLVKRLKLRLVRERREEGLALALLELGLDELADAVLLRDVVGVAVGLALRELEILRA